MNKEDRHCLRVSDVLPNRSFSTVDPGNGSTKATLLKRKGAGADDATAPP